VLNSHEVVRRQILYWERMGLPDDVEIIIMDDGSDPPLEFDTDVVTIHQTHETRKWTSSVARNRGAKIAKGRNLLMADLDYIIPKQAIMDVREFTGQKIHFKREFGVLDENGNFTQDGDVLLSYGLLPDRYKERGVTLAPHPNVYAMNKEIFWEIGGYDERLVFKKPYPQGEDNLFKKRWSQWVQAGKGEAATVSPMIYMFPNGQYCGDVDFNPHGLFHDLTRKNEHNVFWHRQLRREGKT
jgi:hypothetical protein